MLGSRVLGYYTVAHNLTVTPMLVLNPIVTRVAFPILSKVQANLEKLKSGYFTAVEDDRRVAREIRRVLADGRPYLLDYLNATLVVETLVAEARQRRRHFLRNALRLAIASPAVLAYIMSL